MCRVQQFVIFVDLARVADADQVESRVCDVVRGEHFFRRERVIGHAQFVQVVQELELVSREHTTWIAISDIVVRVKL